ncbi:class I SAM-dependent methyltransferase [Gammaproteobacteria bacterium]|nr:class I SAM-dependent methyltransferase [Gammaproteobacteria bacterium]
MKRCRHCSNSLETQILDLGKAPPSNNYVSQENLEREETYYPLKLFVCEKCWLVQTLDFNLPEELFSAEYAYLSSSSSSFLDHAKNYADKMIERFSLDCDSLVVEVASNDGYLLRNFVSLNIPSIGIEPTASAAKISKQYGYEVIEDFFGRELALKISNRGDKADLIACNNVFAHVPNINDFTKGLKELLAPNGVITIEFPHLMELIKFCQFDTVYHEHYSYLSLISVKNILKAFDLHIFDIEKIDVHGGSLRVFASHVASDHKISKKVLELEKEEINAGLVNIDTYSNLQSNALDIKNNLLEFLLNTKLNKKKVVAYGAAAKGNTMINFAGITKDLIGYVCDKSPLKQNKYLPGSNIPIFSPEILNTDDSIDYVLILPWNLSAEIQSELDFLRKKGIKFVIALPELKVF